ncbi:transglutaminase family protein [Hoyosella sp. G463]|uniref:Transglutaminase family protein n=2 Tax=Lolliginicoccus lacisalsi TaxID=2742202 RepID=A0A927PLH5_9ACTN|nr:transglutaminase family protein [Lolliginicoccus lacisalsi]MBD8505387.1 transglutaminase family protein [Lolliginicoccus lacisalsi]
MNDVQSARIFAHIAVAHQPGAVVEEQLVATRDGRPVDLLEISTPNRGRLHKLVCPPGQVVIEYSATVTGQADPIPVDPFDEALYLRPSRYAESDELLAKAYEEFSGLSSARAIVDRVANWVWSHLKYVPGSSGPTDGASQTMLHREGVCRDYAHLTTALLRALDVPSRLVGVYAPGISPMDFHAVCEALVEGEWMIVDTSRLGPRQSMLRMTTGRDAADTAFLSTYGGYVELVSTAIRAVVDGDLPFDDHQGLIPLR